MAKASIRTFGDPVLRQHAAPVTAFHKKLHQKIDWLQHILYRQEGAAALAAPQVGLLKQIVVIDYLDEYYELINPVILERIGSVTAWEGCLSLPHFMGKVPRAQMVTISFQDRYGIQQTLTRSDEMARCFQHEIDHLNGVLYIDRMDEDYVLDPDTDTQWALDGLFQVAGHPAENRVKEK